MKNILSFQDLFESYITDISDNDILAATLIGEAGAEGKKGMTAIYNVLANRAKKKNTSKAGEALRPYRFSMWNSVTDGVSTKNDYKKSKIQNIIDQYKKHDKWSEALDIVKSNPADIIKGSNAYYAYKGPNAISAPDFTKSWVYKIDIGNHKFGYIEKL